MTIMGKLRRTDAHPTLKAGLPFVLSRLLACVPQETTLTA